MRAEELKVTPDEKITERNVRQATTNAQQPRPHPPVGINESSSDDDNGQLEDEVNTQAQLATGANDEPEWWRPGAGLKVQVLRSLVRGFRAMNAPIENLVERLQAKRSGSGWIAKCPEHNDRTPSLSINEGTDGRVLIKCHAGCCLENILTATGLTKADLFPERPSARPKRRSSLVVNPGCAVARAKNNEKADPIVSSQKTRTTLLASAPEQGAPVSRHSEKSVIDWDACNDAFTDKHVEGLAKWRGYSIELCQWLRANKLVGVFNRHIAFPVTENGRVIGVHYKVDGGWRYTPVGVKTTPFVIGE